jgi:hypothetical protein
MMKLEQLELVDVTLDDKKGVLTFLDDANGEIREVNFNKQVYDKDTKKFVDDVEKAKQVDEWCQEYFGLTFENLGQAVGDRKDVYCYDSFNSLWETKVATKFDEDMVGQILNVEVTDVVLDEEGIRIFVDYEGDTYRSNMGFTKQIGGKFYVDPIKKSKQIAKFQEKFGMSIEEREQMVGRNVMIEVKKFAGNNAIYVEVKPFPKKKK